MGPMADTYSPEVRSRVMSRVGSQNTGPELLLRRSLWALGVRGWRCNRRNLVGKPDLAFGPIRLAVFVDGAFWHGHASKYWQGRSGPYWDQKIARNIDRDERVNAKLGQLGWSVLRVWDFEIEADPDRVARKVRTRIGRLAGRRRETP